MKIAISGFSGCGNTTTSKILSQLLSLPLVNYTFRNLSEELGISFEELHKKALISDEFDIMLDKKQVEIAECYEKGAILASRLAIWMWKDADYKIFLKTSDSVRYNRIHKREGGDFATISKTTLERDNQNKLRYKKIYNIDIDNYNFADIVIETDNMSAEEVAHFIYKEVTKSE